MSTRTIAVDAEVYERLAGVKRRGESFSKVIDRLLDDLAEAHTGLDILARMREIPALSADDAERMLAVVRENRQDETWAEPGETSGRA
jgi:predicted CopG family antitoxin